MDVSRQLDAARRDYWEDPAGSLVVAIRHQDGDRRGRALALQGTVSLHRGDLHGAFALVTAAEPHIGDDAAARCEVAALKAHLSFFTGSYSEALRHAEEAIAVAYEHGDVHLRVFARRAACMVFGNVGIASSGESDDLAALADQRLYAAKRAGRDRIVA
jgi:ATP/maltotriose-dependent transcriptional regulator MalT